jgi:uncharacterized coiled-coil protein SlyX
MLNNDTKTRIAVLEQKSITQERLIEKVEDAIQVMKDVVENVSKMLAVHDERIEQAAKSDSIIISMLKEMKTDLEAEDIDLSDRIDEINIKVEEVRKIKWMTIGIGVFSAVLATSIATLASGWLTPGELGYRMEHRYVPNPENVKK